MVYFHPGLKDLLVPIDSVRQLEGNYRMGDVDVIAESMMTNGVYTPVVADRATGQILAGNHRYMALMQLGAEQIPVVYLDADAQLARRVAVVDNRSADLARNDDALLAAMLRDILAEDASLMGTGWDVGDLVELEKSLEPDDSLFGAFNHDPGTDLLFGVTVECPDEQTQIDLMAELAERPGLKVRGLSL